MVEKKRTRAWRRPLVGPWLLVLLLFQAACLRPGVGPPRGSLLSPTHRARSLAPLPFPQAPLAHVDEVEVLEPGAVGRRPVPVTHTDLHHTLQRLAPALRPKGSPRQAAHALLSASLAQTQEEGRVSAGGDYLAEVYRDRALSLVPLRQWGPVTLSPVAEERLCAQYLQWCQGRGGGDCLGLFDDGTFFLTDDRRTLALALALDSVLEETHQALLREVDPRLLLGMLVWAAGMYLALLLVPEPTTKALAAGLTVLLVAYLGLSTLWDLIDGWALLAHRAHQATTFEEVREAGQDYARRLGTTAARALIMGVATVAAGPLGQLTARVRALPVYPLAQAQWRAQGGAAALEEAVALAPEGALAVALEGVEVVASSPQGPLALVLLKKGSQGGGGAPRGGRTTTVLQHRGGNRQVLTDDGQRWHLSRDKAAGDIPLRDPVGDQLQEAVAQAAKEWGPHRLTPDESLAINTAREEGRYWLARLLEREARGRFVERRVSNQFKADFKWNHQSVDVVDLKTGYKYEILSGTQSNLARHGRRMSNEFFRMLTF